MHTHRERLRVGTVPYLVGRPLDHGLERQAGIELVRRVPADLVAMLRARELDVALVSSIELFRARGYRWIDGIGVGGLGSVASVQVFLRRPIEDVRSIAVDPASRAAAALVRVLCERPLDGRASGRPRGPVAFVEVPEGLDPRAANTDAWLRIGDPALREHLAEPHTPVFNPSREWTERTGLPFVFACWIVAPGVALTDGELECFARARERGARAREALAHDAAIEWNLPLDACRRYLLEECRYELGAEMRSALLRFRDEAAPLGLCVAEHAPAPIMLAHVS